MAANVLLICVIYQTIIAESLGGLTLPLSDVVGKVTPIKPKPLSPSTISSFYSSSSLVCDSKNKLLLSTPGAGEYSSPLALTSTSRALPVPKIDSTSIADVKIPEKLREKFVLPKLCCTSTGKTKEVSPNRSTPNVSLPYKYPFLSVPSKSTQSLPGHCSCDMHSSSLNQISSLSNMKPLPIIPVQSLKICNADLLSSASKTNGVIATETAPTKSRSGSLDSPLSLESITPSFSKPSSINTVFPSYSPSSLPYPLYYKSTYLPGVRTPSEMSPLIFRPISYKGTSNFNFPSISSSPQMLMSDTYLPSFPRKNEPYSSPYLNPFPSKSVNPIQLPKTSSNIPVSTSTAVSAQNKPATNVKPTLEANVGLASVAFESRYKSADSLLSSVDLKDHRDPKCLTSSLRNALADKIPDFNCATKKIKPPVVKTPSNLKNYPAPPMMPISSSSSELDVLSNKIDSFDCSKYIDSLNIIPIIDARVETIGRVDIMDTNSNICSNCQSGDSRNVPSLKQINLCNPFAPKLLVSSYQHPSFTEKCAPPRVPCEPIPIISSEISTFSPFTDYSSRLLETPPSISYINQSPSSSIAQTTSNLVSSINDVISNIAQNILSPKQTVSVTPSPVNTQCKSPIRISPIVDFINPLIVDFPISSSDLSYQLPEYEMAASQLLPMSSPQPTVAVLPPTSLITFSSPQLCPSFLPSPTLPSYPTISSPFYMEAPVYKIGPSKKDSDMEKLIELMLLGEILNNDENFDWDDLDTLLAFLSLS